MYYITFDKEEIIDGIPYLQINIRDYISREISTRAIMHPDDFESGFEIDRYEIKDGKMKIVRRTYGASTHILFNMYIEPEYGVEKEFIYGQFASAMMDFFTIQNRFNGYANNLLAPNISYREIDGTEVGKFLDDVYRIYRK